MNRANSTRFLALSALSVLIFFLLLSFGAVDISLPHFLKLITGEKIVSDDNISMIFWDYRWPKALVAFLGGAALAVSGLLMQTFFHNPLAGPGLLGVQSGAALGVAFWTFIFAPMGRHDLGASLHLYGPTFASIVGSLWVLLALLFLSFKTSDKLIILILGLLFGQIASGVINILISMGNRHDLQTFILWSLGSFQQVSNDDLMIFSSVIIIALAIAFCFSKSLNLLLLGDEYGQSMGLNGKQISFIIILIVSCLSGIVTAFCGPISFLGIIIPHIGRHFFKTNNHFILIPGVVLIGASIAMCAELIGASDFFIALPLNAILGILGAPFVMLFLWKNRQKGESF